MSINVTNRREGLALRQEILQRIKAQVQLYQGRESADLRRYALAYKKKIESARWRVSDRTELHEQLLRADLVFGGDFHAFEQAQRVHLRALRQLAPRRKVILGLECIESKYQKYLDAYMVDRMAEGDFLKKIQWDKNWGFPWKHYRSLIDEVKRHGGRALALNLRSHRPSGKNLHTRDRHVAKIIQKDFAQKEAAEMYYVVFGDLHVVKDHLPKLTEQGIKQKLRTVILYLNPEKIYFQLVKKNLEHQVNVIRFSKNEFCLIESPPWVKWQSYLLFLEENVDQALPEDESQLDYSVHVNSLIQLIAADLNIKCEFEERVHSFYETDFLDLLQDRFSPSDYSFVKKMVQADLSFYYGREHFAFLSRGTVNHAAHVAALIVHAHYSHRQEFFYEMPKNLSTMVWVETIAFVLSKLINPHRKSLNFNDLKKQLAAFSPKDKGEESLKIALDQKMKELLMVYGETAGMETSVSYRVKDEMSYYKAAKILGGILGEKIFTAIKSRRLSRSKFVDWMAYPVETEEFLFFYIQVLKELDTIDLGESHE